MPDVHLMFYDTFIIYDHLKQTVTIAAIDLFKNGRSQEDMPMQLTRFVLDLQDRTNTSR